MAQALARHSTPTLTERYTHLSVHDTAAAAQQLPSLLPAQDTQSNDLRMTGTENCEVRTLLMAGTQSGSGNEKRVTDSSDHCACQPPVNERPTGGHFDAQTGTREESSELAAASPQVLSLQSQTEASHAVIRSIPAATRTRNLQLRRLFSIQLSYGDSPKSFSGRYYT